MKSSYAKFLLKKTEDDYNRISTLFSNKRSYLTPDVLAFKKYLSRQDKVADIGCGNGRLYEMVDEVGAQYFGCDSSHSLLKIAQSKYPKAFFLKNDELNLPFDKDEFDVVFSLAVLHHIPSKEFRLIFLKKIKKILKKNGTLILTVWDLSTNLDAVKLIKKNRMRRFWRLSPLDSGDLLYDFKDSNGTVLAKRYIHNFELDELKELVTSAGFQIIEAGYNKRGKRVVNQNIYLVVKKP